MKTITVDLFSFSELSEEAKKFAYYNHYEVPEYWLQCELDNIDDEAELLGIEEFEFKFSDFDGQGQGASFTGDLQHDLLLTILKDKLPDYHASLIKAGDEVNLHAAIERLTGMYAHENTVEAWVEVEDFTKDEEFTLKSVVAEAHLTQILDSWRVNLCNKWFNRLSAEYDHFNSIETAAEILEDSGEIFLVDGSKF